jgi:hypothetical protein
VTEAPKPKVTATADKVEAAINKGDAAVPNQFSFRLDATVLEKIVDFHDDLVFFIIVIVLFVCYMAVRLVYIQKRTAINST